MRLDHAFRHDLLSSPWRVLQAYPLTEEEKQLFVAPNFSWMIENRLAGVSYPRSEDAIALLCKLRVQALLNLSEEPLPLDLLSKYQLRGEHLPVADFTAPTLEQVERALVIIDGFLARGLPVAVHCGAGLGRTGTILACYLVSQGSTAKEAIEQVRTKRPGSIETLAQKTVVEAYERYRQEKQSA
jgi:atypical dual specificity phosphatase